MSSAHESVQSIGSDESDCVFAALSGLPSIALAVSGGPDSLAMLYLYQKWRLRNGIDQECVVLTVNHGLRKEAEEETRAVADYCRSLDLNHEVLLWEGPKPESNILATAREARYDLMGKFMQAKGIRHLVLAHHLDDQAETILIRLIRGSGVYGLGAMASQSSYGDMILIRPFLEIPKKRLIETLRQADWKWCEDPTNSSKKYMRGRLRKIMPELATEGLTAQRLAETASRMRRTSDAINRIVEELRKTAVDSQIAGPVRLNLNAIRESPEEIGLRLLACVVCEVGGNCYVPRLQKIENLYEKLVLDDKGDFKSATIGGTVFAKPDASSSYVWNYREYGRGIGKLSGLSGQAAVWDGRFRIELNLESPKEVCVEPLVNVIDIIGERLNFPENWPKKAFYASPVVSWKAIENDNREKPEASLDYFAYGLEEKTPWWLTVSPTN